MSFPSSLIPYFFLFLIFFARFAFFLSCFLPNFFKRLLFSILLWPIRLCPIGTSMLNRTLVCLFWSQMGPMVYSARRKLAFFQG